MERFREFMGKQISPENVKDAAGLSARGITCTYLADPLEEFDEVEFRTGFEGNEIVITAAVEAGKIKRVMFSEADGDDPDLIRSLPAPRLEKLLSEKGDALTGFFRLITR